MVVSSSNSSGSNNSSSDNNDTNIHIQILLFVFVDAAVVVSHIFLIMLCHSLGGLRVSSDNKAVNCVTSLSIVQTFCDADRLDNWKVSRRPPIMYDSNTLLIKVCLDSLSSPGRIFPVVPSGGLGKRQEEKGVGCSTIGQIDNPIQ